MASRGHIGGAKSDHTYVQIFFTWNAYWQKKLENIVCDVLNQSMKGFTYLSLNVHEFFAFMFQYIGYMSMSWLNLNAKS